MSTFQCPYCGSNFIIYEGKNFFSSRIPLDIEDKKSDILHVVIYHYICSNSECKTPIIIFAVVDNQDRTLRRYVYPEFKHRDFEPSIPAPLARNFEEAMALAPVNPQTSAKLSHQCIQGMLRDFWGVPPAGTLHEELAQVRDRIDEDTLACLESIYCADSIGMRLEQGADTFVDSGEAELMLRMVEMLGREWYLQRDQKRSRRAEIVALAQGRWARI